MDDDSTTRDPLLVRSSKLSDEGSSSGSDDEDEDDPIDPQMGVSSFVFLTYFIVCGGPFGLEVAVGTGYPLLAFLGVIIVPWFWALPLSLMAAELSSAMPSNDGFILWINRAFGPFWSFMAGFLSLINSMIDVAIYPVLFMSYLVTLFGTGGILANQVFYYTIQFGVILAVMVVNIIGVDFVGKFAIAFTVIVMSPFAVMLVWALIERKIHPSDWLVLPPDLSAVPWSLFVNTIIWANGGYDDVGNIAEELKDPKQVFPKATFILLALTVLSYLGSFVAAVSLDTDYAHWVDGTFSDAAYDLGGNGMLIFMSIAALVASLGQFNSLLCVAAQELRALGKGHLLGIKALTYRHSRFRTPWVAIIVCTVFVAVLSLLPFVNLVQIDNVLYSAIMLMEYGSLIKLRYSEPNMKRPYRISQSNALTILFLSPPIILCCYIIVSTLTFSFMDYTDMSSVVQGILCFVFIAFTALLYWALVTFRNYRKKSKTVN